MNGFGIMGAADVESVIRQRRSTADEKVQKSTEEQIYAVESAMVK